MKKILIFILLISAVNVLAEISSCGKFKIEGKIERNENQFYLVLNGGSASENKIEVSRDDLPQIVPYLDKSFRALIQIKKIKNKVIEQMKILEIERNIEHELSPNIKETSIKVEDLKCE
jgi:hypothetical protein